MHFFLVAMGVLALDQLVKYWVLTTMVEGQSIPLIQNIFHLTFVKNYGAAFGILAHNRSFFIAVGLAVAGLILYFYRQVAEKHQLMTWSLALLLGGAVGNLIDRIRLGYVVDLFDFRVWPVFNVADMAIVGGVMLLGWIIMRMPENESSREEI